MSDEAVRMADIIDGVHEITKGARHGPRYGVTPREAALYDKGYDDALDHVRAALGIADSAAAGGPKKDDTRR